MDSIELVKEFHKVFGHSIRKTPGMPFEKDHIFRSNFIREELDECHAAGILGNFVDYVDALGDLQYVLDGWFLNAGLQDKKQAILEEIHRSNMTKACNTESEAERTIMELIGKDATLGEAMKYYWEKHGELYIVYRTHDRKVMKSINYQPPNLKAILNGDTNT